MSEPIWPQPGPRWVPVAERLPDDFTPVLTTNGQTFLIAACSNMKQYDTPMWTTVAGTGRCYPTHWMPLPYPPVPNSRRSCKSKRCVSK